MDVDMNSEDSSTVIESVDMEMKEEPTAPDVQVIQPDSGEQPDGQAVEVEPEEAKLKATDHAAMMKAYLPDDPNYTVTETAVHTWELREWRSMERRLHGPTFECGGSPWRILFFPFGNNCDCASFYLEHGFEDKPPENWYRCVQFGLVLWNPNDPEIFVHHVANHRFTAEEGDWGFTRFAELRDLQAPTPKRKRPLIENEAANITAFVKIIEDPTGVLWHNFVNYDSKKETGYVGLKNQGATCYLNSLVQSLYFTNSFRKAVYKIPTEKEENTNSALALQRLFYLLQTSADAVSTMELTRAFGWETADIFAQQDVQELSRVLMEALETKMKGTEVDNILTKLFVGKTTTYIRCINVDYASKRLEDFWDLQLNVRGFKDLLESFKDYIAQETMEGDNKYAAEGHGLQDAKKGVIFETFPDVLHLQLKRFEYDLETFQMQKVNDHYEFPEEFDAAPFLSEEASKDEPWEYVLHGVLVHSGDLNAGHYYAFIKTEKDGDFYKFDDDRVTRATRRETMDENFGGDHGTTAGSRWKRQMNAYMLVYIRKSRLDDILVPISADDTPSHLQQRLDEERAERERRKKEREEQHLYLNIRYVTEKHFQAHQGFDLVSWEEKDRPEEDTPKMLRVLKTSTVSTLADMIGSEIGIEGEKLRLWVLVNRQNKTVRPDQPLLEVDRTIEEITQKHTTKGADFRLYAEAVEDPLAPHFQKDPSNNQWIVVFLKYYDPYNGTLRGVKHAYVKKNDKVSELFPIIQDIMSWSKGIDINLYEEIKPTMIEAMKPKQTFNQAEIQDGDIICFQKANTPQETEEMRSTKIIPDAKEFYEHLVNLIHVRFTPKPKGICPEGAKEIELELSKKDSYEEVCNRLGKATDSPPDHLRLWTVAAATGLPRTQVKRTLGQQLSNILQSAYYTSTQVLHNHMFYEILDMSLSELETKKALSVIWLHEGIIKDEQVEVLVPKNGAMSDVIEELKKKFNLSDEQASKVRTFAAHAGKVYKVHDKSFNVAGIQEFNMRLYAEVTPDEELNAPEGSYVIDAFHYAKEPSKPHQFGTPFRFLVIPGEKFDETRKRIQARTGIKGKPLEQIKFSIVKRATFTKPVYLNDDDVISEIIENTSEDNLGLDHPDRGNLRTNGGKSMGPEIRIK